MTKLISVFIVLALAVSAVAWAAGGKMRLSDIRTDIDELYLLCEQAGVRQITLSQDGVEVVIQCEAQGQS
jgi:hypothetical protein